MTELKSDERLVAKLVLNRAGDMHDDGRKQIAAWLRECADHLENHGHEYSARFTARKIWVRSRSNARH